MSTIEIFESGQGVGLKFKGLSIVFENRPRGITEESTKLDFADVTLAENWLRQILQKNEKNITELTITEDIYSDGYATFGEDLSKNTTVNKLNIKYLALLNPNTTRLFDAIANNTSMKKLGIDLQRSQHEPAMATWKMLTNALKRNKSIQTLQLKSVDHQKTETIAEECAIELFSSLASNDVLTELLLVPFDFSNKEMIALGEGLKYNKKLEKLTLFGNFRFISECRLGPVGDALKHNNTIKNLSLLFVKLPEEHLQRLFDGLIVNTSISKLMWDGITLGCATDPLVKYLRTTQTLFDLEIGIKENDQTLWQSLSANKSIKKLNVRLGYSNSPTSSICQLIRENTYIKYLSILGNLKEGSDDEIEEALKSNFTLIRVVISNTQMTSSPTTYPKFQYLCDRNYNLQKQRYEDTAVIMHNILRSILGQTLPLEIWTMIFGAIDYPGLNSLAPRFKSIANRYLR